jgi:hypothetical protein
MKPSMKKQHIRIWMWWRTVPLLLGSIKLTNIVSLIVRAALLQQTGADGVTDRKEKIT